MRDSNPLPTNQADQGSSQDAEGVTAQGREAGNIGETSDGYHTFNELYEFRLLYNAALWNEWAKQKLYKVHKSWHHADAPYDSIFAKGWFIVVAELPTGQISNHYPPEDWVLFQVTETPVAHAWDGHTATDVADRLRRFVRGNDMMLDDPEANSRPSESPSLPKEDTTTLREQLLNDMRLLSEEYFGNETYGKYLSFNHKLQAIFDRYCQEIASEARLDELTSFPVDKKFPEQLEYIVSRSSELTHQPPEAT